MIHLYYGASYAVMLFMTIYEVFCFVEKIAKKRYYIIPIIFFPISFLIAYCIRILVMLVFKVLQTEQWKILGSWLSQDLRLKNKRKGDR